MSKLQAKPGSMVSEEAANDVGGVWQELYATGKRSAADLLEAARDPESPAHKHFEWDDSVAAEKFRLGQAKKFIRSLEIVESPHSKEAVRGYWKVPETSEYKHIDEVVEIPSLLEQLISQARRDLDRWSARYAQLRAIGELHNVFEAIDKAG